MVSLDYMHLRQVFSLDPERFPIEKVRELVDHLHANDQQYIVMVDPAIAAVDYDPYHDALDQDVLMKYPNGTYFGAVWAGTSAFPDWFHPNTTQYWNGQFATFFSAENGEFRPPGNVTMGHGPTLEMPRLAKTYLFSGNPPTNAKQY